MKSGYKLFWTDRALNDLKNIIDYLSTHWTEKEIRNFARRLDRRLEIILLNPALFTKTNKRKQVHKSVLTKHTIIYYKVEINQIKILTLFDPRQNPAKLKL